MRKYAIYVLTDPKDGRVRYVGRSMRAHKRLSGHVSESRKHPTKNHRTRWISSLLKVGLQPNLVFIQTGIGDWAEAERGWVAFFRALGCDLTNSTDGGDGTIGYTHSVEAREKMAEASRQQVFSLETRAKMSASHLGMKFTPEHRAKLCGPKHTAESRARIAQAKRGVPRPPDMVANMRGRKRSDATKTKISVKLMGSKRSAESIAKSVAGYRKWFAGRGA
jgi:hypothetical protein